MRTFVKSDPANNRLEDYTALARTTVFSVSAFLECTHHPENKVSGVGAVKHAVLARFVDKHLQVRFVGAYGD